MNPIDNLLPRLEGVRERSAGQWLARCPSHEDRSPSLSIREVEDSRVLVYCFGGCVVQDVVSSLGLTMSDLFPEDARQITGHAKRPRLNGWDAIAVLQHRILMACLALDNLLNGKPLEAGELSELAQALSDIRNILGEAYVIR